MRKMIAVVFVLVHSMWFSPVLATDAAVAYAHYARGEYADAYREYRGLAEVGYAPYQSRIARMLARGEGVERNLIQAYAWYALAASQGDPTGQRQLALLSRKMSSDQLRQGAALAEEYGRLYVAPYRPHWQLDAR